MKLPQIILQNNKITHAKIRYKCYQIKSLKVQLFNDQLFNDQLFNDQLLYRLINLFGNFFGYVYSEVFNFYTGYRITFKFTPNTFMYKENIIVFS